MSSATTPPSSSTSASASASASGSTEVFENSVHLHDGRVVHYAVGGDLTSRRIFLALHGVFVIGSIPKYQSKLMAKRGWMSLSPTLPGWGQSSPFPKGAPLNAYVSDVRQVLDHALAMKHEVGVLPTHIVVFGGSYGSVWAYSVVANCPPKSSDARLEPNTIRGLIVMGGFSPFRQHTNYGTGMSMMNYLGVGRLGLYPPFNWMHAFIGNVIRKQVANNVDGSLKLLRQILTGENAMTVEERNAMKEWTETLGITFEEWELSMAKNMSKSISNTLDGYSRVCETLNSDWGFQLENITVAKPKHAAAASAESFSSSSASPSAPASSSASVQSCSIPAGPSQPVVRISGENPIPNMLPPIILCGGLRDHLAHIEMMRYVNTHIPQSQLLELSGNHISGITSLNTILQAVINGIEYDDDQNTKL